MNASNTIPPEKEIFLAALEKGTPEERIHFLESACGRDEPLKTRLAELLRVYSEQDQFMACSVVRREEVARPLEETPGTVIDRYRILRKIGEGGTGIVYAAEQLSGVRREVALKVLRAGMDSSSVVARFEVERQALALMDHPNIARVFDGGATEQGRPFFAMELVHGERITSYCDRKRLPIVDRLRLFVRVCDAVQHAHQKAIIHRDLKPSNILVVDSHPEPSPRIIDFGIAKAAAGKLSEATVHTGLHQFIGTPAYMSPEQADLSIDVDTRTDIYSLGVLLYELLTGGPPFDNQELLTAGLDEMRRIIREVDPKSPSALVEARSTVSHVPLSPSATANHKSVIDADLDCIVLKCLEKDRARRYETASAVAADIQRHLDDLPIIARPPRASARFGKFVRRNKALSLASAAIILCALTAGILISSALLRERAARQAAELRLGAALGFVDAIADRAVPDLESAPGGAKTIDTLASSGLEFVERLRSTSANDPRLSVAVAKVLIRLSRVQGSAIANHHGDYESALATAQRAAALLESVSTEDQPEFRLSLLSEAYHRIAMALENLDRASDAYTIRVQKVDPLKRQLEKFPNSANDARTERVLNIARALGDLLEIDRADNAVQLASTVFQTEWYQRLSTNSRNYDLRTAASVHGELAFVQEHRRDWSAMLTNAQQAIVFSAAVRPDDPMAPDVPRFVAEFRSLSGFALIELGRIEEGISELQSSLATFDTELAREPNGWRIRELFCMALCRQARARVALARDENLPFTTRQGWAKNAATLIQRLDQIVSSLNPPPKGRTLLTDIQRAKEDFRTIEGLAGPVPPGG